MSRLFQAERDRMVEEQIVARGVRSPEVLRAMRRVPREAFLPAHRSSEAYLDCPVPLGPGSTLSQPYIVALMLDALGPVQGKRVLEVGSGCGYVLTLLEEMGAEAYGIELDDALAQTSRRTLAALGMRAQVKAGDGAEGWPEQSPFDALMLSCATPQIAPGLLAQCTSDAIVVFPEGAANEPQMLIRLQHGHRVALCPVAFVGLRR
jgi:protein-L-isoaspartate(D-aspartate) O-methyltransferase